MADYSNIIQALMQGGQQSLSDPVQPSGQQQVAKGLLSRLLTETWPARAATGLMDAAKLPGQVAGGILNVQPSQPGMWSDEDEARSQLTQQTMRNRATDLAGLIMGGTYGAAPANALGMAGGGLREKYAGLLWEASGGKDPMRIKLTPERIEKAKELYQNRRASLGLEPELPIGSAPSPYRTTPQSQEAIKFAEQAIRSGQDVRMKYPDDWRGSVYVRVGDHGTARFADHLPPIENGQIVGGYSKTLGRRHQPATVDVSRGRYSEMDAAPAYDWLAKLLAP